MSLSATLVFIRKGEGSMRSTHSLSLGVALGAFGGAALVLSHVFFTPGKYILFTYAAFVVAMTLVIRAERISAFSERFLTGLIAFIGASLALYVTVVIQTGFPIGLGSIGEHAWRIGFILAMGAAINLPAARIARPPTSRALHA